MKLFITGATGFIGSNLINKLMMDGHQVIINIHKEKPEGLNGSIETYVLESSPIDQDILYLKNQQVDGIIHLASLYITNHAPNDATKLVDSNVRFATYILECAVRAQVPWFINTGTFWQHYENKDYSPVNLYAATKQAFNAVAKYYVELGLIRFYTLKLSDTFGPNDVRPKIFNYWDKLAKTDGELDMSAGEQIIDISFIDDVVDAFLTLIKQANDNDSSLANGDSYAVKALTRFTLRQLSEIFCKITGANLNINWGRRPYREREVMIPWENGQSLKGWRPKVSLEEGIKRTFSNLNNKP